MDMLQGYPAETLHETIAKFHDTEDRLRKLKAAINGGPLIRVAKCKAEIDFVLAREKDCSVALQALREGKLPLRVTHNDTKLNNILIDRATGEGICVIDLDTTMPGLSINDFGESIRFGANHSAEDEKDLSKVNFDIELYEVYTRGFLEGAQGSLTRAELEYLPWGARLMTLECGIRFLTDYLELNKEISDILDQSHTLSLLNRQGMVDPDIFITKNNQLAEQLRQAKQQKIRLQELESSETIDATRQTQEALLAGPEILDAFDEELFCELIDRITVQSNTQVRFRLKNGLELTESMERTVR